MNDQICRLTIAIKLRKSSRFLKHFQMITFRDKSRWGPRGLGPPIQLLFFFSYHIFYFYIWVLPKPQAFLLLNKPNQFHPNSNYPIKKLNKNNKVIHNDDFILAKKKKNYFTTKEPKNHVLLKKLKLIFLQLQ